MNTLRQLAILRRFLTIGQQWRRRSDRVICEIRQVYRVDRRVLMRDTTTGAQFEVRMVDLLPRGDWLWIAPPPHVAHHQAEEATTA